MRKITILLLVLLVGALNASADVLCMNALTNAVTIAKICPRGTTKVTLANLFTKSIPKGTTVYGLIGGRYYAHALGDTFEAYSNFPAKASLLEDESEVQVAHTPACPAGDCLTAEENDFSAVCTGSVANPTAPAGKVCIYPSAVGNAHFLVGFSSSNLPANSVGFGLGWEAQGEGDSWVRGIWAYKQP